MKKEEKPIAIPLPSKEEDIRQTYYDGWAKDKKFVDIEISELEDKSGWIGKCKTVFGFVIYRDTKQQAIYAMNLEVSKRGYEIGNLPEIYNLVPPQESNQPTPSKDSIYNVPQTNHPPSKDKEVLKIDSFCILDNISMIVVDGKEWLHYDETKYYIDKLISLLKDYEQWEADILTEDKLWWPNSAKDVLSGKIYDTMIELQHKRNQILYPEKYTSYITTQSKDKEESMFTLEQMIDGYREGFWQCEEGKELSKKLPEYFKETFSIDISNK